MQTSLEHLPARKRQDLALAVKVLFAEFEAAVAHGTSGHKRNAEILKIVLFGSYATGKWVEDPLGGYFSDYDLLVVVNDPRLTDVVDYWGKADERLTREYLTLGRLSAPVSFIVHDLADVNDQLRRGRYFFKDIARDGIALYEAAGHPLASPVDLAPVEALVEAQGYFDEWFESAGRRLKVSSIEAAESTADPRWRKEAAFDLHQGCERLYNCLLLVTTLYSPKSHRLTYLRSLSEQIDERLATAWPRETKLERRCFELLRRAYIEARYSAHFKISAQELAWLSERTAVLQEIVETVCRDRLAVLAAA